MRFIQIVVLAVAALVGAFAPAQADKRVALLTGDNSCADLPANEQLRKALNGARAVGAVPFYGDEALAGRVEFHKLALLAPPRRDGVPLTADQAGGLKRGDTFGECTDCPQMAVAPAGPFTMGSSAGEHHVTVDQFGALVRETGQAASTTCHRWPSGPGNGSWRDSGFARQGSPHPVACVTWNDAQAYGAWLANKTGPPYRLLSEAEFEHAARGQTSPGSYPRFWFGDSENDLRRYGNGADQQARSVPGTSGWTCGRQRERRLRCWPSPIFLASWERASA